MAPRRDGASSVAGAEVWACTSRIGLPLLDLAEDTQDGLFRHAQLLCRLARRHALADANGDVAMPRRLPLDQAIPFLARHRDGFRRGGARDQVRADAPLLFQI